MRCLNQPRAPTRPERAASGVPVSPATQPRPSRGGACGASRKPPEVRDRNGRPAGVEGTCILARNGDRAHAREPQARNGRSRATRRAAAASGAGRYVPPSQPARHSLTQPLPWRTQKGRGRLGHRETTSPELTALRAVNVPRPRKHRRHEERSGGRGMPSGRGLSLSEEQRAISQLVHHISTESGRSDAQPGSTYCRPIPRNQPSSAPMDSR
jgi:hypothetical protein